jgi:exosome complex component RRP42
MKEKAYNVTIKGITKYLAEGKRYDGREPFDYRDIVVETNISQHAEGSVRVKVGKTEVLAGIKMSLQEPYPDHSDEGTMMTGMEMLPLSNPAFDYGPPTVQAIETSRVIDRGIRESGFIDFNGLCIKEGELVWNLFIDLAAINDDGNLLDVGALAALIALRVAKMPKFDEETKKIIHGEFTENGLPLDLEKMPITISTHKIGEKLLIDPCKDEELSTVERLTTEISSPKGSKEPMVNAMQKAGDEGMTIDEIDGAIMESGKIFKKLNDVIETAVKNA